MARFSVNSRLNLSRQHPKTMTVIASDMHEGAITWCRMTGQSYFHGLGVHSSYFQVSTLTRIFYFLINVTVGIHSFQLWQHVSYCLLPMTNLVLRDTLLSNALEPKMTSYDFEAIWSHVTKPCSYDCLSIISISQNRDRRKYHRY